MRYFPADRRRRGRDNEEEGDHDANNEQKYTMEEKRKIRIKEIKAGIIVSVSQKMDAKLKVEFAPASIGVVHAHYAVSLGLSEYHQ